MEALIMIPYFYVPPGAANSLKSISYYHIIIVAGILIGILSSMYIASLLIKEEKEK